MRITSPNIKLFLYFYPPMLGIVRQLENIKVKVKGLSKITNNRAN